VCVCVCVCVCVLCALLPLPEMDRLREGIFASLPEN